MNWSTVLRKRPTGTKQPARARLLLERLEDRTVLSSNPVATVADLIAAINVANAAGGSNTITLAPGNTFTLAAQDDATDGGNGLPVITANDKLTIVGNGDTIARSTVSGTPDFRLFDIAAGASLTVSSLTLQGGWTGNGGAILNQGALDLKGVTVQHSVACSGGGIYSTGSLIIEGGSVISGNTAQGEAAYDASEQAGSGYGGGLYVASGTVTMTSSTISSNAAFGGTCFWDPTTGYFTGGGGFAYGGGLYVASGTVSMTSVTVTSNTAQGGLSGRHWNAGTAGCGGGICVAGGTVTLTDSTLSSNVAQGGVPGWEYNIGSNGGWADGGGVYVAGGTVSLTGDNLSSNSAIGASDTGHKCKGGSADGGGVFVAAGGIATLRNDTLTGNSAQGGAGPTRNGPAQGGGLYIEPNATVYLNAFTKKHTTGNTPDDIHGKYTLIT